jgi:hypothetical protein
MRNIGNTTWTTPDCYALGVLDDPCGLFGGAQRIPPPPDGVGPDEAEPFIAYVTAPTTPMVCTARLRMVREFVEWFGPEFEVSVTVAPPPNSAQDWRLYE